MEQIKDLIINKLLSRKLLVFITATVLLILSYLSQDLWFYCAILYTGANIAEGLVNVMSARKQGGIGAVVAEVVKEVVEEQPKEEEKKDAVDKELPKE